MTVKHLRGRGDVPSNSLIFAEERRDGVGTRLKRRRPNDTDSNLYSSSALWGLGLHPRGARRPPLKDQKKKKGTEGPS
jgi:hypothetical protein